MPKNLVFCCFFSLSLFGLLPGAEVVDEDRAVLDVDFAGDETVLGQLVLQAIQPGHLKKRTISLNINKKDSMFRRPYQCPVDGFVAVALRPVPGAVLAVGGGGADGGLKRAKSTSNTTYVDQGRAKDEELGIFQRQRKKHNAMWLSYLIATATTTAAIATTTQFPSLYLPLGLPAALQRPHEVLLDPGQAGL